ncbi:trp operon repressor [Fangia hongkongensis]|uniref:trp operon repressor n=1 Tax=Fangia hongkongensis TaxID=270495 RepID=UPI00035D8E2A|nr:trp operon repressor [Fangia hongkongensis]MBK2126337.1 trp operon repressor [Fangia hongkongensis]
MEPSWQKLNTLLTEVSSVKEMTTILDFLLTAEEKVQIANRISLTNMMIYSGKPQREIAKELGVSISTVTRCSNALKTLPDTVKEKFK